MAIAMTCACGEKFSVREALAGRRIRCKTCGSRMVVPQAPEAAVQSRDGSAVSNLQSTVAEIEVDVLPDEAELQTDVAAAASRQVEAAGSAAVVDVEVLTDDTPEQKAVEARTGKTTATEDRPADKREKRGHRQGKGPLAKMRRAKAEVKQRQRRRVLIGASAGAGLLVLCILGIVLFRASGGAGPNRDGGANAGKDNGGKPGGPPSDFVVVSAAEGAPPLSPEIAKRKEQRRLAVKLAQEAPPFDPASPPTMRSTFAQLASRTTIQAKYIEMADKVLHGEALPEGGEGKFIEQLLRGHRFQTQTVKPKGAWDEISIDRPKAPFQLNLATGIPLEMSVGGSYHLGVMNGPYYVPFPWWLIYRKDPIAFELSRDPKEPKRYIVKVLAQFPAHPIIDLRDGKTVGEFDWQAPVWANARLSPDGSYLVGTDTFTTLDVVMTSTHSGWQNGKDLLFIWAKGKKSAATLKVPGVVDWMEFVADDQLAYVTYAPEGVLRIHDVAKNQQVAEIPLPGVKPSPPGDDNTPIYPGVEFFRPVPRRGAVSAAGKYIALGCPDGVRLVSVPDRKIIGLFATAKANWCRSLNFSPKGDRLFGIVSGDHQFGGNMLRSWSVATGEVLDEGPVDRFETGPIFPGPAEGLYVGRKFFFTRQKLSLQDAPFRIFHMEEDGTALVAGTRDKAPPDTPPCRSLQERIKANKARPEEAERKDKQYALFTTKVDWSGSKANIEPVASLIAPRPEAFPGDKTGIAVQKPSPPAQWQPPSFSTVPAPAAEGDDMAAMHQFAAWPESFGDDKAALVRYVPRVQPRKRWEIWLDLLDRNSGKRAAPAAKLWDWAHYPTEVGVPDRGNPNYIGRPPLPVIGALKPDAELFALVDPDNTQRLDLFKPSGERVLGLVPFPERRIDWLGWSRTHLLTAAGGRFTSWDPATGKAVFDVDGDYTHAAAVSPDRKWVTLWTGKHADILDSTTGKCLGRCAAGGFSGQLRAFTLSPDGKRLAAVFTGSPKGFENTLPPNTPGYSVAIWNLETGKAGLHGFVGGDPATQATPTCAWAGPDHLLVSGRLSTEWATLIDARLGISVGAYAIQGGAYSMGEPFAGSPDGRLWYATTAIVGAPKDFNPHDPNHPDFPAGFVWHTAALPGLHGKDTSLSDPAREWSDPSEQPVQVEVKAGDKGRSETVAKAIARALQAKGFRLGQGGTVLRVEATLEDTDQVIHFFTGATARVPRGQVSAQWFSAKGIQLWTGKKDLTWSMGGSKYLVSEKFEFGPGGLKRYEFDFKGRNPSEAMREELLEKITENPAQGWLQLPEVLFLHAQGRERALPVSQPMLIRMPPDKK